MKIQDLEGQKKIWIFTDKNCYVSSKTEEDMQDVCQLLSVIGLLKKTGKESTGMTAPELEKRFLLCCAPCQCRRAGFHFQTIYCIYSLIFTEYSFASIGRLTD